VRNWAALTPGRVNDSAPTPGRVNASAPTPARRNCDALTPGNGDAVEEDPSPALAPGAAGQGWPGVSAGTTACDVVRLSGVAGDGVGLSGVIGDGIGLSGVTSDDGWLPGPDGTADPIVGGIEGRGSSAPRSGAVVDVGTAGVVVGAADVAGAVAGGGGPPAELRCAGGAVPVFT